MAIRKYDLLLLNSFFSLKHMFLKPGHASRCGQKESALNGVQLAKVLARDVAGEA